MNLVPRQGGNTFSGSFFGNWANDSLQTQQLHRRDQGGGAARAEPACRRSGTSTAPSAARSRRTSCGSSRPPAIRAIGSCVAGMFDNLNAGDAERVDLCRRSDHAGDRRRHVEERERAADVAGVAAQQVQLLLGRAAAVHVVHRRRQRDDGAGSARQQSRGTARAAGHLDARRSTSQLLLEAGFGTNLIDSYGTQVNLPNSSALIPVTEQCTAGCAANGGIAGLSVSIATAPTSPTATSSAGARRSTLRDRRQQREVRLPRPVRRESLPEHRRQRHVD